MMWVLAIAAVKLVFHLLTAKQYGYFRDEFYYMACGRHLAWGYVDQAPLIAQVAAVNHALLGDSLPALRLWPALAGAGVVVLAGLMARDLGGGRIARAMAAVAVLFAPVYLGTDHLFTMNSFETLFWALAAWVLIRILRHDETRLWPLFGVVAGGGLMNKHSTAFFLAALYGGMLLSPERRRLLSPGPWIAAALAALILSPNVIWQIQHGWPTLEFLRNAESQKNLAMPALDFLKAQVLVLNPLSAPLWIGGLLWCLFAARARQVRTLGFAYLLLTAFLLSRHAKVYYLTPVYPMLFASGGVALDEWLARARARWAWGVYGVALTALGILIVPLAVPVFAVEREIAYIKKAGVGEIRTERHRQARLPQTLADMFGWDEMVADVSRVYHTLPPQERAHCAIYTNNYGQAGAIDFLGKRYGLPSAISGHNSYWMWGPGDGTRGEVVITVGEDSSDVAKTYYEVTVQARHPSPYAMPFEMDAPIVVGRRPRHSLREVWESCKRYI